MLLDPESSSTCSNASWRVALRSGRCHDPGSAAIYHCHDIDWFRLEVLQRLPLYEGSSLSAHCIDYQVPTPNLLCTGDSHPNEGLLWAF
jgi:hypothetical protein